MLITDHDSYNGYRAWKRMEHDPDFVVLKGIEYDTLDAGHMLVVMPETVKLPILELRGLPLAILIEIVHRNGGIIGPAHPCGERFLSIFRTGIYKRYSGIASRFDFMEGFNACEESENNDLADTYARMYVKPAVGGSDAHWHDCVGMGYTVLEETVRRESELIRYFRDKKPVSCGGKRYYGTTKDKLGKANHLLVQSFWFYNRLEALRHHRARTRELTHLERQNDAGQEERK